MIFHDRQRRSNLLCFILLSLAPPWAAVSSTMSALILYLIRKGGELSGVLRQIFPQAICK